MQEALVLSEELKELEAKLRQAGKEGVIKSEYLGHQIDEAEKVRLIDKLEAQSLRDFHEKVLDLMSVDDFAPEGENQAIKPSVKAQLAKRKATVKKKSPTKKTPTRNTAKKKTAKKASKKKTA